MDELRVALDSVKDKLKDLFNRVNQLEAAPTITSGSGGGAPVDAQYLVLAFNAILTDERRLDFSARFATLDGGAGGDYDVDLAASGVGAAVYGSATQVAQVTVDVYGRITNAADVAITGVPPAVHNVLDSTYHGDVLTGAIVRGDILYGNATPKIARLPLGGISGSVITRNATDVLWSTGALSFSGAHTLTIPDTGTAVLGSGAAGRIPFFVDANTLSSDGQLLWDNVNKYVTIGTEGVSVALHGYLHVVDEYDGNLSVNIDNTHVNGQSFVALHTLDGAGDPQIGWGIRDATWVTINHSWHAGIDNSDSDKWKLAQGSIGDAGTTRISITLAGYFGLMTDNPESNLHVGQSGYILDDSFSNTAADSPYLLFRRGRGSLTSPTQVLSGDRIGMILFRGLYDVTHWGGVTAAIIVEASENLTSSANGSSMRFEVTPVGSTTRTERMRIQPTGDVSIGTSTDNGYRLDIAAGAMRLAEITAPSAPAANSVVIYAEDNGAGKTRLMALFATGAAQQIAIQP
jgi:hypothetical protein